MRVCFGVFDWGLGHATRDMPLIARLLRDKHEVHIISTGRALSLLRSRFGDKLTYFDVPSLTPPYTRTRFFASSFLLHIPRMMRDLARARKQTERILAQGRYDRVISDCRYDVYDKVGNSYFINHQVRFHSARLVETIAEAWLAGRQERYRRVLVPDFERDNLTGRLSHELRYLPRSRLVYVGVLSQLRKRPVKKDIDCFVSISGPEPQRTVLERLLLPQLAKLPGKTVVALGKPEDKSVRRQGRMTIHGFLDRDGQERMMNRARFVITRSGYTTMMELYELEVKRALLIPTPGQTEQEYLADLYEERGWYPKASQRKLDVAAQMRRARGFSGFPRQWKTEASVERFLDAVGL